MRDLGKPHQELHQLVRAIIEHKAAGRVPEAEGDLARVETLSQPIVSLIEAVERKAGDDRRPGTVAA
jgi:hypothetical protein